VSAQQTEAEAELAQLLVQTLNLQDVKAPDIVPANALFGFDGQSLGLDSIDALEIALAVQRHYGVELRSDDPETRPAFASLQTLSAYILKRQTRS
jgi:acyl carrier protein